MNQRLMIDNLATYFSTHFIYIEVLCLWEKIFCLSHNFPIILTGVSQLADLSIFALTSKQQENHLDFLTGNINRRRAIW